MAGAEKCFLGPLRQVHRVTTVFLRVWNVLTGLGFSFKGDDLWVNECASDCLLNKCLVSSDMTYIHTRENLSSHLFFLLLVSLPFIEHMGEMQMPLSFSCRVKNELEVNEIHGL